MALRSEDQVDRQLEAAERDASPGRFPNRPSAEIERIPTASSGSSSSSSVSGNGSSNRHAAHRRPTAGMSRISTARDLERHPTEMSRIATANTQHGSTVGAGALSGIALTRTKTSQRDARKPLPEFGAGKGYPPDLPAQEDYVVEFDGPEDPLHPQNWPFRKKIFTAAILGYTTMIASFASSIFSAATTSIAAEYGVSPEIGILGVSFFVLGFAFGPTLWAPLSELRGRRLPIVISMFGFFCFNIAGATAENLQTILITRFFAGFFGACPLAVVAAVFSDMFSNATRGLAIAIFSMTVFTGPLLAPFIGGFIVTNPNLGWRWTLYLISILSFVSFAMDLVFLQETYPPVVLVGKAKELRRRTLNWGIHAKQEEIEVDFQELITKNFSRPIRMLFTEPIVLLISIYMSFVYGILYLFLTAYPLVFQGVHHFSPGISGLMFFGMILGQLIAGAAVVLQQPWYLRKLKANNGVPVPEWRLPSVIAGGVAFMGGIFWFGWSGYRADIHWIVPTLSGILTGFGLLSIFLQALNYIVDAYLMFAASAIAGNTLMRSLAGATFPLFALYMFDGMGIQWASTLLGCVAAALVPIPVVFYLFGAKIRKRSKMAPTFSPAGGSGAGSAAAATDSTEDESEKNGLGAGAGAATSSVPARKDENKAEEAV